MKRYRATAIVLAIVLSFSLIGFTLSAGAASPVAENMEISTYRGVSAGGRLRATDPDGDAVTFVLTTEPTKGRVEIEENGRFVYTPDEGKKGKDYFGYEAVDSDGNRSQEGTVIISICRQKTDVAYGDMEGNGAEYASLLLAEKGVFIGEFLGGEYVFDADREVSRGELLAMCMSLTGEKVLSGVSSTGFKDDGEIPAWMKPYVSTALMSGYISGYQEDEGSVFDSARAVSSCEAAVMLNNVLGLTDVSVSGYDYGDTVPVWAAQSAANLDACNIVYSDGESRETGMTRAEAAEMLAAAMRVLDERK